MLPATDKLSELLGSLYDAAGDPTLWPIFLRMLSNTAGGTSAAVVLHDPQLREHALALHSGYDAATLRRYVDYYGDRDIWIQRATPRMHAGWIAASEEFCSADELIRTEFYNDFLRPAGVAHAMWATIECSKEGRTNTLGLYRKRLGKPFGSQDCALLQFLLPHMKRAFRLHFQFAALGQSKGDLQVALDLVAQGMLIVGAEGKVVAMNRAAEKLLQKKEGLRLKCGRLESETLRESAQLNQLITESQATSVGKGWSPGGAMKISRKGRSPLDLLVTPVRNVSLDKSMRSARAIVFVQDPELRVRPPEYVLRANFSLTPAESRVALLIADGKSPREIAQLLGVSSNTLKSHLASVYRKTKTARQSQLVRLLMTLAFVGGGTNGTRRA